MCGVQHAGSMLTPLSLWGMSLLLLAAIVGIAIWAMLRWHQGALAAAEQRQYLLAASYPAPAEILRERYARGEIDLATFEAMLARVLSTDPSPTR